VRVQWVRAEPTPQQARAWRRLWQKLLASNDQDGEPAPPPRAVKAGDGETSTDHDHEHGDLQAL
jgi:hypothetical protein